MKAILYARTWVEESAQMAEGLKQNGIMNR
jgi:hypothetical protein